MLVVAAPYPGTPEWAAGGFAKSKTGQLPLLEDGDVSIGQGRAIMAYLIKKFEIAADMSVADYAKSEELTDQACGDMHSAFAGAHYAPDRTAAMDKLFGEGGGVPKTLGAFEDHVDGTVTPGHCAYAAALNIGVRLQPDCLDNFPKTKAFYETIMANEGVKAADAAVPYPYFKRNSD
ncbi:hypothetical protein TeGR_g12330 [Tetraparma gracilis]|uniref:GST N-terminal domain-containing protein n=1 Tax=Tetraparma gracilis TaxID=2962635 RepID=A0ABQ6M4T3_9STRA|nr:hypothetical protein TeGR_g12330 [Tetraparma gracilis]